VVESKLMTPNEIEGPSAPEKVEAEEKVAPAETSSKVVEEVEA